jgi:hypothetical protein
VPHGVTVSTWAPPPWVPLAPSSVTAVAGGGQASVSWVHNHDNCCTAHRIITYAGGAWTGMTMTVGSVETAIITGLTNGTAYTFTVTAGNQFGWSPESAPSNAVTPLDHTVTAVANGTVINGILLRVLVLTGAATAASQTGATVSAHGPSGQYVQAAIVTTATGSMVYGAMWDYPAAAYTANATAATTFVDDVNDTVNNMQYGTCRTTSATGTPGSVTVGASSTVTLGGIALAEILPAGTITADASAPAVAQDFNATAVTTASFTPPGGALVVALVSSNGGAGVIGMTVSSTGHSWAELNSMHVSGWDYCGIWISQY